MAKTIWQDWKKLSSLEKSALKNIDIAKNHILKHIPRKEIVSIYLKGSFIRREMDKDSDLDFMVVVRSSKTLNRFKKLKKEMPQTANPPLQIGGHSLWELKHNKRVKLGDGKLRGSPSRNALQIPFFQLIYGREISPSEINFGDNKKRLNGMIRLIKDTLLPMYERGEWGFSNIIKPAFWLIENSERAEGRMPPYAWKLLAKSIPDKEHMVHRTLNLRLHPTRDQKIRKKYIEDLKKYIESLEKKLKKRKGGWQVWVDFHKGYVVKTPKSRKEIRNEVVRYLNYLKSSKDPKILVNNMVDSIIKSTKIVKKSGVPRKYLANAKFLKDGTIRQDISKDLGSEIKRLRSENKKVELKGLIDGLFKFIGTLWEYKLIETTYKFNSNFGVLDGKLVLIDFLELSSNGEKLKIRILSKKKFPNQDKIKELLGKDLWTYYVKRRNKCYSIENYERHWGIRA